MEQRDDKLNDDKLEQIRSGVEALQHDQARRNVEEELIVRETDPDQVFTKREQEAIKSLVHDALVDFFSAYGLKGKNAIITLGIIFSSIAGIVTGVKVVVSLFGNFKS